MANQAERNKIIADYDERMLICRQGQHRWPPYTSWKWKVTLGLKRRPLAYRLDLECEICGKVAHDTIDANTGDKKRTYTDPKPPEGHPGYRIPRELDVTRADLRLEMLHRFARDAEPIQSKPSQAS